MPTHANPGGWGQILAYMAFCEVSQEQTPGTDAYAGDFGFKVLTASDPAEKTKKLNAEIANGRLAMMAIIGMFFQAETGFCARKTRNTAKIVTERAPSAPERITNQSQFAWHVLRS